MKNPMKPGWQSLLPLMCGVLFSVSPVAAEVAPSYDRIGFSVSAEKAVENDELTAVLFADAKGQDTGVLADQVNKAITWAMEQAKQHDTIESRTLGYTTTPVYNNNRVDGWQVRQNIELKSQDSKLLSGLLGELQAQLKIQSINYSISAEVLKSTEALLISDALAGFKNRASQIQANMERSEYRVVRLNINTASDGPPMMAMPMARMAMTEAMPVASPGLDAGKQKVRVSVDAEIELSAN